MEKLGNSGVYMILNTVNMKVYIGSSVNFKERKYSHFNDLLKNKHDNPHLQHSYNKYGKEKFIFIVLERNVKREQLFVRENHYIKQKDSLNSTKGYNMAIPCKDDNMFLRPETIELKRRAAYVQWFGEIKDEAVYVKWRENKLNPTILTKEELKANARERFGKTLYGVCQTTNKILVKYNSVQEAMDTLHRGVQTRIDKEGRYVKKMAIVSEENYDPTKDYRKKYAPKYKKKYTKKGPRAIETFNPDTSETIRQYKDTKELALALGTTVKYVGDVRRGEKGRGLYKGVGIRYSR